MISAISLSLCQLGTVTALISYDSATLLCNARSQHIYSTLNPRVHCNMCTHILSITIYLYAWQSREWT